MSIVMVPSRTPVTGSKALISKSLSA
jgi:hypothetical protein